jgi:hypothetical protein
VGFPNEQASIYLEQCRGRLFDAPPFLSRLSVALRNSCKSSMRHEMLIICDCLLLRFASLWMYLCNNAVQYTFLRQGFLSPKRRKATYSLSKSYPHSTRRLRRSPTSKSLNSRGFSAITADMRCFSKPNTATTVAEKSSGPKRSKRSSPTGRRKRRRAASQRTAINLGPQRF